jgi:type I restriction enzyme S subunit
MHPIIPLGDVARFNPPAPKGLIGSDTEVAFVPMASVSEFGTMAVGDHRVGSELNTGFSYFQNGDVLVAKITPCYENNKTCAVHIDRDHGFGSTEFHVIRPSHSKLDTRYLTHFLRQDRVREAGTQRMTGSAGQRRVPRTFLETLRIPLPPLNEQRRIAAILDQSDDLRRKRREAMRQIDFLTLAIFEDMFGDPVANSRKWTTQQLKDLTLKIGSGSTPTGGGAAYESTGTSLIRSMNVHDGRFKHDGLAFINELQAAKLDNVVVHAQDVLLNITGASVARVCRAPNSLHGARVNQHVAIIRPIRNLLPRFLESALLHPKAKTKLLNIGSSGATREAITKAHILQYDMIVPPLEDQLEFERRGIGAEALADCLLKQSHLFNAAFASLQHRAFNGEL